MTLAALRNRFIDCIDIYFLSVGCCCLPVVGFLPKCIGLNKTYHYLIIRSAMNVSKQYKTFTIESFTSDTALFSLATAVNLM